MSDIDFVLLRGLGRESGHWCDFPDVLQSSFPGCRIFKLDQVGSGDKSNQSPPLTIEGQVSALHQELDSRRKIQENRRLVGVAVSMGGMSLLAWAHRYPKYFDRCILINSSVAHLSWPWQRLKLSALTQLVRGAAQDSGAREKIVVDLVFNHAETREKYLEDWQKLQKQRPNNYLFFVRQLIAAARFSIKLNSNTSSYNILASTNDRLCDVTCSIALAAALHCTIIEHPTAGHDLVLDDMEWTVQQIMNALDT